MLSIPHLEICEDVRWISILLKKSIYQFEIICDKITAMKYMNVVALFFILPIIVLVTYFAFFFHEIRTSGVYDGSDVYNGQGKIIHPASEYFHFPVSLQMILLTFLLVIFAAVGVYLLIANRNRKSDDSEANHYKYMKIIAGTIGLGVYSLCISLLIFSLHDPRHTLKILILNE